jgi:nucleotide-binding universal stress UspA family protein
MEESRLFKKILVPLDGSPYAESILDHVKMMAASCNFPQIVLLMVIEPLNPEAYIVPENILEEARKKALAQSRKYIDGLAADLKKTGISAMAEVIEGNPSETILDYARKNMIDMITLSTHGRTGITRWALGSNTDRVIRRSPIPILVVSPPGSRRSESN